MESLTGSLDPSFSFVNITEGDLGDHTEGNMTTLKECDYSLCQIVSDTEPAKDFSEAVLNVNRSLLAELQSEQNKNLKLTASFEQMKNEFDDLKINSMKTLTQPQDRNESTSLSTSPMNEYDKILTSVSSLKSNRSIKEEHLIELNNYLQSELAVCKKEMYAMNSRMVDFVEIMKLQKKQCSDASTQTEENLPDTIPKEKSISFLCAVTQTEKINETVDDFSMVPVVPEPDILAKKLEDELHSLQTWFTSTFKTDSTEINANQETSEIEISLSENVLNSSQQTLYPNVKTESIRSTLREQNSYSSSDADSNSDGIPLTLMPSNLTETKCPICDLLFGQVEEIQMLRHVNEHLDYEEATIRRCPKCSLNFTGVSQNYFELHVQSHFGHAFNDTPSVDGNFYAHSLFE